MATDIIECDGYRYQLHGPIKKDKSVYKARRLPGSRDVSVSDREKWFALKLLPAGSTFADRFSREVSILMELTGRKHVIPILGEFETCNYDGMNYGRGFVMPYCPSLSDLQGQDSLGIKSAGLKPMAQEKAAELVMTLADELARVNEGNPSEPIVHRDIKPANILRDESAKRWQLADFGSAKRLSPTRTASTSAPTVKTGHDAVIGTPGYMPPEQYGQQSHVDECSDVFAFGATLYELVTGYAPFPLDAPATNKEIARETEEQRHRSIRQFDPRLSRALEAVVDKCLNKKKSDRYPNCRALANDLGRLLRNEDTEARLRTVREKVSDWIAKNPIPTVIVSSLALMLVIAVFSAITIAQSKRETERVSASHVDTLESLLLAESELGDRTASAAGSKETLSRILQHVSDIQSIGRGSKRVDEIESFALSGLGRIALNEQNPTLALKLLEQSRSLTQQLVDAGNESPRLLALWPATTCHIAEAHLSANEYSRARSELDSARQWNGRYSERFLTAEDMTKFRQTEATAINWQITIALREKQESRIGKLMSDLDEINSEESNPTRGNRTQMFSSKSAGDASYSQISSDHRKSLEAYAHWQRALNIVNSLLTQDPTDAELLTQKSDLTDRLGVLCHRHLGRLDEAEDLFLSQWHLMTESKEKKTEAALLTDRLVAAQRRATIAASTGANEMHHHFCEEAMLAAKQRIEMAPDIERGLRDYSSTLFHYARSCTNRGDFATALQAGQEALRIIDKRKHSKRKEAERKMIYEMVSLLPIIEESLQTPDSVEELDTKTRIGVMQIQSYIFNRSGRPLDAMNCVDEAARLSKLDDKDTEASILFNFATDYGKCLRCMGRVYLPDSEARRQCRTRTRDLLKKALDAGIKDGGRVLQTGLFQPLLNEPDLRTQFVNAFPHLEPSLASASK